MDGSTYSNVYLLALLTGLRRSEALALRWSAVDLEHGAISIVNALHRIAGQGLVLLPPKSTRSRRRVTIPAVGVDMLRSIRGQQIELAELTLGQPWNTEGFVFCREDGSAHDPEVVTKDFSARAKAAGFEGITFHSTRHTHASLLLAAGENIKTVSDRLGHASVSITGDIYSHVLPEVHEAAAERFAERLLTSS